MKWLKKIVIQILEEMLKRVSQYETFLNSDQLEAAFKELKRLKEELGLIGIESNTQRRIER